MGGNAFQGLSRMTKVGYIFAKNLVTYHLNKVGLHNHYITQSFEKESYGDVDVFLDCSDKSIFEQDSGLIKIIDKRINGESIHYLCETKIDENTSFRFQVDLNYCDNPLYQAKYFSYGGLCVFLSLTAKKLGFKFTNTGLYVEKEYINLKGRKEEPIKIKVEYSFDSALVKLGFSPIEFSRITNFEEAVLFLKRSKYFDVDQILNANIKQKFEFFEYFKNNHQKHESVYKNNYLSSSESKINFSYLALLIRRKIKERRTSEHLKNRFNFKRVNKLSNYLLAKGKINHQLLNEELGLIIKLAKDRYSVNPLKYESRAMLAILLQNVIIEYCMVNKS